MPKVELSYNPYLMETEVKFNGKLPGVSSLVKRYEHLPLQDWISEIPRIFRDEMNGYDFVINFSGTKLGYEGLQTVFNDVLDREEVPRDKVRIFHKNELEDREVKDKRIDDLLKWLGNNANKRFSYDEFWSANKGLFDDCYTYIIIQGKDLDVTELKRKQISVEKIDSIKRLDQIDLAHVPILFYISRDTKQSFEDNLKYIIDHRKDIKQDQLFFLIADDPDIDRGKEERNIRDWGIEKPKIVSDVYDDKVERYFQTYPITYYIKDSIEVFRKEIDRLTKMVEEEDERSQSGRDERKSKIKFLDQYRNLLEKELDEVTRRDNIEEPKEFREIGDSLSQEIDNWKNNWREYFKNKVKIGGDEEARKAAEEFRKDLKSYGEKFCKNFTNRLAISKNEILEKNRKRNERFCRRVSNLLNEFEPDVQKSYNSLIQEAKYDYTSPTNESGSSTDELDNYVNDIHDGLLQQKEVNEEGENEYYYSQWRGYVKDEMRPFADSHRERSFQNLKDYFDSTAGDYIDHIEKLLGEQRQKKKEISSELTEDERSIQEDRDWLNDFKRRFELIERE